MPLNRTVICMKWGTLYPTSYVNVLYQAVKANLTGPFRFVCLTEDAVGLHPDIDHFPIPDMNLEKSHWRKGGWAKLSVFKPDLYDLEGRALFIDLDSVIAGPLDDLFDYTDAGGGEIAVIDVGDNWIKRISGAPRLAGTGVFTFTIGAHPQVFDKFMADRDGMVAKYRIEQVYLENEVPKGTLSYWPADWVLSFKYHLRRPVGLGVLMRPKQALPDTRIIAFHGEPRPIDLVRRGWWGIAPHLGRGRVPWMMDYWARHGGDPERD